MREGERRGPLREIDRERDACGVGFVARISGTAGGEIVRMALGAVRAMAHRGAIGGDARSGDGAGILTPLPEKLLDRECRRLGLPSIPSKDLAVAVCFLPRSPDAACLALEIFSQALARHGLKLLAWRSVPVETDALGPKATSTLPDIRQAIVTRSDVAPESGDGWEFERRIYLARKEIERRGMEVGVKELYIPSFSSRTLVYKALLSAPELGRFYPDLCDPDFQVPFAIFHQRYSTNTNPTWALAQPFRLLAHNGEINTIAGNRNWMRARERRLRSRVWGERVAELCPVIWEGGSDSASLDNALELLVLSGRNLLESIMMLMPEAFENIAEMDEQLRAFYRYSACAMEPWDGPAAVAFTDGRIVGAALDRNGLRPSRYLVTEDGLLLVSSEAGVLPFPPEKIAEKGRLGPGEMIAVDIKNGRLLRNLEIKREVAGARPYRQILSKLIIPLADLGPSPESKIFPLDRTELLRLQRAFGYTLEDTNRIIEPMARRAEEPTGSMGDDTPLSVLSEKSRLLYSYFKQRFAQVTNPPIDPLRERSVMSLDVYLGGRLNPLDDVEEGCRDRIVLLRSPILSDAELAYLFRIEGIRCVRLPALFDPPESEEDGGAALASALSELCRAAEEEVERGASILVLSDRDAGERRAPIPMLLAVGAVHHHLMRAGKRTLASLVAETGEAREDHHFACLIGYGASAVNPYLAFQTVARMIIESNGTNLEEALANYRRSVEKGLLKIMAKMGISTLSSYHGAQVFEILGLEQALVDSYFSGTPSRIGGLGLDEIARAAFSAHREAFSTSADRDERLELVEAGYFRFRRGGEYHAFNPDVLRALHRAARGGMKDFERYAELIEKRPPVTIRDLLDFLPARAPVPLEEVEPAEEVVRRFSTSAMSHGALSREAHETLAIAMNRIGARSNSGEGGEDPARYRPRPDGSSSNSATKQVASARFGVTPEYLVSASELEIKMAQGSKPGEGGQLPGHKVSAEIAAIRHSTVGVTLISPPPHHDIYSIEDLAQLIYDLRRINPRARIAVKLVAEAGVGTVAAGVAKAHADVIHISGHDGGTGASPLSSIKNAGIPWELGLAEAQQMLLANDLRRRVVLRVDGGLKSGRDVVIAALLGADEYGFGSAALVALGCVMARQCHLNTCPVGIATQRPELRARFAGSPEMVINFFFALAEEVRRILARLGFRRLEEAVGRSDLLYQKSVALPKKAFIDLSPLLADAPPDRARAVHESKRAECPLDDIIAERALAALDQGKRFEFEAEIKNTDRTVGARLAGEIARRHGDAGLPDGTVELRFRGSAGQSFGAFCIAGMRMLLEGEANDYVGKGMAGGEIAIRPPEGSRFAWHENVIAGNTCLYGATGGRLFLAGRAGERFAVRNSGAEAVVEGIGDHGCEYMTRGAVVVLGATGRNFGAGMTGGLSYVLDEDGAFPLKLNRELVAAERIERPEDSELLRRLIARHLELTGSPRARLILENWERYLPLFWKVSPKRA